MNEGCVPKGLLSVSSSLAHFDEGLLLVGLGPFRATSPVPARARGQGF
jgi:hypothetical protein